MTETDTKQKNKVRLDNAKNIRVCLSRIINMLINDEISTDKARAIGYLLNITLGAIETTELTERIIKLEDLNNVKK